MHAHQITSLYCFYYVCEEFPPQLPGYIATSFWLIESIILQARSCQDGAKNCNVAAAHSLPLCIFQHFQYTYQLFHWKKCKLM